MKANELMIGDWIYRPCCSDQVKEIRHTGVIGIDGMRGLIAFSELKPIPLTPEILEKNGFKLDTYSGEFMSGKWWTRNDFVIHESMNDSVGKNNFSYKYVHQLQHALRLCGIEKEIIL